MRSKQHAKRLGHAEDAAQKAKVVRPSADRAGACGTSPVAEGARGLLVGGVQGLERGAARQPALDLPGKTPK
jgi:hypothetical protein